MTDINTKLFGTDLFGDGIAQIKEGILARRFEFPPFSVLNAREGLWQDRKRAWIDIGLKSEIGRGASPGDSPRPACDYSNKERGDGTGRPLKDLTWKGNIKSFDFYRVKEKTRTTTDSSGTSLFDPVLCELMYRWFCPEGGQIVDPFAGGSVRGIVAGLLGYKYHGIDLSQIQIDANEIQKKNMCPDSIVNWVCGDAIEKMYDAPLADFIFSCPPYGDLERYSDDPRDLSTMEYHTFIANYKRIILRCAKKLNPGGMACFVVGDFRDKKTGFYRGFVADTIKAFQENGLELYNDAVLITCVGSLPIRVGKQFESGRKLGKTHQNILVFKKHRNIA
jgi:DNA modification methylase